MRAGSAVLMKREKGCDIIRCEACNRTIKHIEGSAAKRRKQKQKQKQNQKKPAAAKPEPLVSVYCTRCRNRSRMNPRALFKRRVCRKCGGNMVERKFLE